MGVDHFLKNNVLIMYSRNEWKKKRHEVHF